MNYPCKLLVSTEKGIKVGWVYMHLGGWVKDSSINRFSQRNEYTPASEDELGYAVSRGELAWVDGFYCAV